MKEPNATESRPVDCGLGASAGQKLLIGRGKPLWVFAVAGLYALIFLTAIACLVYGMATESGSDFWWGLLLLGVIVASQFALVLIPIRVGSRRPVRRGSLWLPLCASGLLCGVLVMAVGLCVAALLTERAPDKLMEFVLHSSIVLAVGSWIVWVVVFYRISASKQPEGVGLSLHNYLLKGSVLELLIALPAHIIERQRDICSASGMTFLGMCTGIAVMFVAFGPSIAVLFVRRCMNLQPATLRRLSPEAQRRRVLLWSVLSVLAAALLLFLILWVGLVPSSRGLLRP